MAYSYKDYWSRLHDRNDLSAVGQSTLPAGINGWIYRTIRRNLRRFAQQHGLTSQGGRMLEVGVGTGYWIDFWEQLGWKVDGCDLVPAAVERLQQQHPTGRFWAADVSSEAGVRPPDAPQEQYDLVTATSVILHVTQDEPFLKALENLAAAVKPGGHLLLVEPVLTHKKKQKPYTPEANSRARLRRSYVKPLRSHGFELVSIAPTTVLAANPLEARSPRRLAAYQRWWRLVAKTKERQRLGQLVGPLMYIGDAALMLTKEAPTSKIMLLRKTATGVGDAEGAR